MKLSRTLIALLASGMLLGSAALAAPPGGIGIGAGAGVQAGVHVPPLSAPPLSAPPVNVPHPQTPAVPPAGAKANAHGNAGLEGSLAGRAVVHGTLTNVTGTAVTLLASNGTTQTYTVSAQTATRLQSYLNKTIAYRVQNGTLSLVGAGTPPLRGTLVAVNGTTARIKLSNGTTQSYTIAAQQATWLSAHTGKTVAFWANENGTIELNQSSHAARTAQRRRGGKGRP